jgi:hypothetical protein
LDEIEVHVSWRIERVEELLVEPADSLQRVVLCLKPTFLIETFKRIEFNSWDWTRKTIYETFTRSGTV